MWRSLSSNPRNTKIDLSNRWFTDAVQPSAGIAKVVTPVLKTCLSAPDCWGLNEETVACLACGFRLFVGRCGFSLCKPLDIGCTSPLWLLCFRQMSHRPAEDFTTTSEGCVKRGSATLLGTDSLVGKGAEACPASILPHASPAPHLLLSEGEVTIGQAGLKRVALPNVTVFESF